MADRPNADWTDDDLEGIANTPRQGDAAREREAEEQRAEARREQIRRKN